MNRTEGEYWAKRPLTQEMIIYAATDVIALIPEMYTAQKRILEEKGLTRSFKSRVEQELKSKIDRDVAEALKKEKRDRAVTILKEFAGTAPRWTQFKDITDDNVVKALICLRPKEERKLGLPAMIGDLKLQQINAWADEVQQELLEKGKDYNAHGGSKNLRFLLYSLDPGPLKDQVRDLVTRLNNLILEDIQRKYTTTTPVAHIAPYEKDILSCELRPGGEIDPTIEPTLLKLYWKIKQDDLERKMQDFQADSLNFKVSEGFAKKLRFYVSGPVPEDIKKTGKKFLKDLERMGKVSRPPHTRGKRHGYRGGTP